MEQIEQNAASGLRLYSFTNFYISPIQHGIQTHHAGNRLWGKYMVGRTLEDNEQARMLMKWSTFHETDIVLNGGDHAALVDLERFMDDPANPYPWTYFTEPGLNNAFTSVVIILPQRIYDADEQVAFDGDFTEWEMQFIARKSRCGLAR